MRWHEIKAHLVKHDSDEVDYECGYHFELPLNYRMQLVAEDWKQGHRPYKVTRYWTDEPTLHGQLILHMRHCWLIKYAYPINPDPTVQLGEEVMRVGEFLSIRDHASDMHTFRITSMSEIHWVPTAAELGI